MSNLSLFLSRRLLVFLSCHVDLALQLLPVGRQRRADADHDVLERRLVDLAHVVVQLVAHLVDDLHRHFVWGMKRGRKETAAHELDKERALLALSIVQYRSLRSPQGGAGRVDGPLPVEKKSRDTRHDNPTTILASI